MLNISPPELWIGLQHESYDPRGHGSAGAGPGVARGAAVVEVGRDHFPLPAAAAAVGGGHGAGARFTVPGDQPVLRSAGH